MRKHMVDSRGTTRKPSAPCGISAVRASALAIVLGLLIGTAAAAEPNLIRLKLRPSVEAMAAKVSLADVLACADCDATVIEKLAQHPARLDATGQQRFTLTHAQVVERLESIGLHPGEFLLEGAAACEVRIVAPPPVVSVAEQGDASDVRLASREWRQPGESRTLAAHIRQHVDQELSVLGGNSELDFERAGQDALQLTSPPWEFDIRAVGREKLGLREFRVTIRRDGRAHRTVQVFARVRLVRDVVVTRRPLSLGNFVKEDDLALERRVFDETTELGLTEIGRAVGQQVRKFVPAGGLVTSGALKSVDLVQRAKPVTVLAGGEGVQMRLSGVALDAGSFGQTIRVRLGEGRSARQQLQAVVVGPATVRLAEGLP